MDEQSLNKPLVPSEVGYPKEQSLLVSSPKWILKIVMWVVFILWVSLIFLYPGEFGNEMVEKLAKATSGTPLGTAGSLFLVFSAPILVIAVLAVVQLIISGEEVPYKRKISKFPSFLLWTFPVLVDGPFGVVSAAEFLGILFFVVFLLWAVYAYTLRNLSLLAKFHVPDDSFSIYLLEATGVRFGMIGLLCMVFLFLPISRGSVLLRVIGIPFEHATRYHVWLGHITMMFFTLHGLFFVIGWWAQGTLIRELLDWKSVGVANLPGVISLLAGLLMWVTSLGPVRKRYFELFFYTHQLYVVFVVFLALHVGDFIFSIAAGGIFLFILDRFLRSCQSRRTVDVLSAKSLPCGTVELVISKPANLKYNALSFIFLQVRELSWLQWHPFSVSSSPLDGKHHMAVLIKVLGGWTAKLRDNILKMSEAEQEQDQEQQLTSKSCLKITASVEGPYGHESPYHLMYENLILVAGGIGISPFFAILNDILHRIRDGKPCLPRKILVVWAIKKSDELSLLSMINLEAICPSFSDKLKLEIHIYVTRQTEPQLEEGLVHKDLITSVQPVPNGCPMSVLVGTGDNIWSGLYVISSTVGLIVLLVLLYIFYINKFGITAWWYKGLLFLASMVASVIVFGGPVVGLWHIWGHNKEESNVDEKVNLNGLKLNEFAAHQELNAESLETLTEIRYGLRPDFKEIFGSVDQKWGGVDVGVIVCGPETLQTSVAREIRSHNLQRSAHHPIFHFNSHSFDL